MANPRDDEDQETSLDDDISKLYDELEAEGDDGDEDESSDELEASDEGSDDDEPRSRARDRQGRFAKADEDEEGDTPESQTQPTIDSSVVQQPQEPLRAPLLAPGGWSKEEKEVFASLPRAAQEAILRRETEQRQTFTHKTEEAARIKEQFEPLAGALEPHRGRFQKAGVSDVEAVSNMLAWQEEFESDPVTTLHRLAATAGLSLAEVAQQAPRQFDPAYRQMIQPFQNELKEIRGMLEGFKKQEFDQKSARAMEEINQFIDAKDASGRALHPFAYELGEVIGQKASVLRKADPSLSLTHALKDAYYLVVQQNPEVQAAIRQLDEKAKLNTGIEKAKKAKRAGSSIVGSSSGKMKKEYSKDLGRMVEELYDELEAT